MGATVSPKPTTILWHLPPAPAPVGRTAPRIPGSPLRCNRTAAIINSSDLHVNDNEFKPLVVFVQHSGPERAVASRSRRGFLNQAGDFDQATSGRFAPASLSLAYCSASRTSVVREHESAQQVKTIRDGRNRSSFATRTTRSRNHSAYKSITDTAPILMPGRPAFCEIKRPGGPCSFVVSQSHPLSATRSRLSRQVVR